MGRPPGEPSKVVRLPLPVAALAAKRLAEKSLRAGDINAFFDIKARRPATVPLMATSASEVGRSNSVSTGQLEHLISVWMRNSNVSRA
jgi:hypothetical protein